jgi:hypothetical protein
MISQWGYGDNWGYGKRLHNPLLLPLRPLEELLASPDPLRQEGRRAPLSQTASSVGNTLLPVGDRLFVLFDDAYARLVLIEYRPKGTSA